MNHFHSNMFCVALFAMLHHHPPRITIHAPATVPRCLLHNKNLFYVLGIIFPVPLRGSPLPRNISLSLLRRKNKFLIVRREIYIFLFKFVLAGFFLLLARVEIKSFFFSYIFDIFCSNLLRALSSRDLMECKHKQHTMDVARKKQREEMKWNNKFIRFAFVSGQQIHKTHFLISIRRGRFDSQFGRGSAVKRARESDNTTAEECLSSEVNHSPAMCSRVRFDEPSSHFTVSKWEKQRYFASSTVDRISLLFPHFISLILWHLTCKKTKSTAERESKFTSSSAW